MEAYETGLLDADAPLSSRREPLPRWAVSRGPGITRGKGTGGTTMSERIWEGFSASKALCDVFVGGDYAEVVVVMPAAKPS